MLLYVLVMLFWRYLLGHVGPHWARVLIALLPAVLVVLVIRAVARVLSSAARTWRAAPDNDPSNRVNANASNAKATITSIRV